MTRPQTVRLFTIEWLHVNESNPKLLDLQSALAEMQRLREENVRLRCLLQEHGIQIPAAQSTTGIPVTTNALPSAHIPVLRRFLPRFTNPLCYQQQRLFSWAITCYKCYEVGRVRSLCPAESTWTSSRYPRDSFIKS